MKVEAEVRIRIIEGEEKGSIYSFITSGETQSHKTEFGIIERLRLEWNHFIPYRKKEEKGGQ